MGWLFHQVPAARYHDRNAEIDRIFRPADPEHVTFTILQRSWVGSTCYVACRVQNFETGKDVTFGVVILTKSYMENGQRWWGYKDVEESSGPYHTQAPKSLIAKLDPTDNEYALKWREACLARTRTPRLTKFRTASPVQFGNFTAQEFEKVQMRGRKGIYRDLATGQLVRMQSYHLEGATPL